MDERNALELIGSFAYDLDIPIETRMDLIVKILKSMDIDYSYEEIQNA